ncbi:type VI secretion system tube protein Hcp [Solirubrobacter ginsenosidimutans]|uniref:Type VI secretion system tube protein Hcp n=1 Tax=Solirubrobacter ginsenosidimutans TaxID=490573 RepID=A0A9X3MSL2_9ACTN|nr:type VI secretion system tube protein Hcp [Solirubrobacter ginsenosidimutans]MDA0162291.1 type VI secretion system tube protein Hcp [Solirubrobacter ginsenosidimutans]
MAANYFLRIDGIPGESTDEKHKGEIPVLAFSWGEAQSASPASGGGGGAGKVSIGPLNVTAVTSKASPPLLLACASGKHLKSATLTGRKAGKGQLEFLTFSLSDVLVSDYQVSGSEDTPIDTVSLAFAKIQVEYREQKADGSAGAVSKAGWDVKANKKI